MGLDLIELELEVEREFDIRITNEAAQEIATPRQLAACVQIQLLGRPDAGGAGRRVKCASQVAFYRLRAALVEIAGVPRRDVRPDTRLADLLPADRVSVHWRRLAHTLGMRALPRLQPARGQVRGAWFVSGAIGLPLCWYGHQHGGIFVAGLALVLVLFFAGILMDRVARQIPDGVATVRALVPYVPRPAGVPPVLPAQEGAVDPEILGRVIELTARIIGLPADRIGPDQHFIDDLGMG